MTDPKPVWITDVDGNKASVTEAEADRFKPLGWAAAVEPAADDMVWLQHDVTGGKQLFATAVVSTWEALGWKPSAPPEPVDLTKDTQLVDVVPVSPEPKTTKAVSGSKKEQ